MKVLISGSGIAGPSLAFWLARGGHQVTLLEKAPALRSGGYIIDFWGRGYDLAERMGILPQLLDAGYQVREVRLLGKHGERRGGFPASVFDRATGGRFTSLPRGELARTIHEALGDGVETLFGTEVSAVTDSGDAVEVALSNGETRRADVLVGAEGVHSRVRDLVFGPEERFERFLGYGFAACTVPGYSRRDEDVYVMYGEPGRQVARFALRDGSTLVLFIWCEADGEAVPHDSEGQRAFLRQRYAGSAWEVPAMLEALDAADDLYCDRVSQIVMDRWHRGRIVLLGDAAFAPSFLAGQGCALAMIGGYVLAGELGAADGDVPRALAEYQARLGDFMGSKQKAARGLGPSFVPRTPFGLAVRERLSGLLRIGPLADMLFGRSLRDQFELPDYG